MLLLLIAHIIYTDRRNTGPYDIGDRIAVSNPEKDTNIHGSTTWFVEDLGLYSTTVRLAATNGASCHVCIIIIFSPSDHLFSFIHSLIHYSEVATYSNGSLSTLRIINANRSPQAVVSVLCKFSVNVSYSKVELFKKAAEKVSFLFYTCIIISTFVLTLACLQFVKARPREWIALLGFRATTCEPELGYIEYTVTLQVSHCIDTVCA